jgi:hypothetical protein
VLLRSQSNQSGLEWMIVCSFWENVFQFSLATEDEVVAKESALFISKLLEKTTKISVITSNG